MAHIQWSSCSHETTSQPRGTHEIQVGGGSVGETYVHSPVVKEAHGRDWREARAENGLSTAMKLPRHATSSCTALQSTMFIGLFCLPPLCWYKRRDAQVSGRRSSGMVQVSGSSEACMSMEITAHP